MADTERELLRDRILEDALDLEGPARFRYVAEACGADLALAAEIERVLGRQSQVAPGFLDAPARIEGGRVLAPGATIGRYVIESEIGAGGAGQVYRALDTQIQRRVAIKVLRTSGSSEEDRQRFLRELRTLGAINHDNVVQLYDFGEHEDGLYLVLEFLTGEDLRAAIDGGRCGDVAAKIETGRQIAAGLVHIHSAGIIHRDLKPANIFLLPSGRVKLMDFGIARADNTGLTLTGQIAGTPAYMAPEQLEGDPRLLTPKVDVHAFGVTLYELFTGERAFNGASLVKVLDQVRHEPVRQERMRAVGVPETLARFLAACADKDPARRPSGLAEEYERAIGGVAQPPRLGRISRRALLPVAAGGAAVAVAGGAAWLLRARGVATGIRSLAVLPFVNATGDPKYDYIAMGVTEGLITSLGYVKGLMVSARAAVLAYQNKAVDPREVGERLGVEGIVTGTVRRAGDALNLLAELADTAKAAHLLSLEQAFREEDLSRAHGSIASQVAAALQLQPGQGGSQPFQRQTQSGSAYQDYLYGRHALNKRTMAGYQRAVEYFSKAVEADAKFSQAWAGLADAYSFQSGLRPPREVFPLAQEALRKGGAANPRVAELHASAGFIHLHYTWDWPEAEREFQAALALNENDSVARGRYARLLTALGRFREAESELRRVRRLDPVSLTTGASIANCHYLERRFDDALREIGKVLELEPGFMVGQDMRADILVEKAQYGEAIAIYEKEVEMERTDAGALASLVRALVLNGDRAQSARAVDKFRKLAGERPVNPSSAAIVEIALGNPEKAIAALQDGYRQRYWPMIFLGTSPLWDSLRARPEFQNLLKQMNLR